MKRIIILLSCFFIINMNFSCASDLSIQDSLITKNYVNTEEKELYSFSEWSKKDLRKANTAKFAFYIGKQERKCIQLINLVRINPQLFLNTYLVTYYENNYLPENYYTLSLVKQLKKIKSREVLRPSFTLQLSAVIHAFLSGINSYKGHKGFEKRMKLCLNFNRYTGECCDYGSEYAIDILFSLLIDEGVPSLGHRGAIIDKYYRRIGVSSKRHKEYDINTVLDFTNGNWIDWLFYKPYFSNKDSKKWRQ